MKISAIKDLLDSVGLLWFSILLAAILSTLVYLAPALWQTWAHDGPTLVTKGVYGQGFVAGHDFVAFHSASTMALRGDASLVYSEEPMKAAQHDLVGDDRVGYLAFMYPPTYLLLISPLSLFPYFASLALWLILPLVALLTAFRLGTGLPAPALILVLIAPAVAQSLFAGQNGPVFAAFLFFGFLLLPRRPSSAGFLLGLATAKPQLGLLILPALIAGRQWRAAAYMVATLLVLGGLATVLFGTDIWSAYAGIPALAREWLAAGRLPWVRMPTVYAAARLIGFDDFSAILIQGLAALAVLATVAWAWWRQLPFRMRVALLLAGVPLTTPFMYDYDLPLVLPALALYLADAVATGWRTWEKVLLLLVWLQPAWWWTVSVSAFQISVAPLLYATLFVAIMLRAIDTGPRDAKEERAVPS